jgi:hypothetical protein
LLSSFYSSAYFSFEILINSGSRQIPIIKTFIIALPASLPFIHSGGSSFDGWKIKNAGCSGKRYSACLG